MGGAIEKKHEFRISDRQKANVHSGNPLAEQARYIIRGEVQ
jgi:hypothetical protein